MNRGRNLTRAEALNYGMVKEEEKRWKKGEFERG